MPPNTPWWAVLAAQIILAILALLASYLTARASTRREQGDLNARVKALEDTEPAAVEEVRAAAKAAADAAAVAQKTIDAHVAEERDRRRTAAKLGEQRDAALATKLDGLAAEVRQQGGDLRAQGAQLDMLRDYVMPGDSRRGR